MPKKVTAVCVTRSSCSYSKLFPYLSHHLLSIFSPMNVGNMFFSKWKNMKQTMEYSDTNMDFRARQIWISI
jgi:hypothetical protein